MRTSTSSIGTTGTTRRAPVVTTLAAVCMALPLSGLLGGTAYAATTDGSDVAALKVTSDKSNSATAQAAAEDKKDAAATTAAATTATAAPKPGDAGFVGPVAPAAKAKDTAPAADSSAKDAAKSTSPKASPQASPFTNVGGVTTGSNTTTYETVADKKGSTFTGVGGGQPSGNIKSPQPYSNADKNNTGANDTSATNPYTSTRDGAPSLNGNGGGKQIGQPCAACVGKADNKNPPGQAPNATDGNAGYECDRNHGIGRSNPAHTACVAGTPTTPPTTPTYDCKGHLLPNNHDASECDSGKKYDCKGHLLPNNHDASECDNGNVKDELKITLCHATSSDSNPYVTITVDENGALNGHEDHADDIIPSFTYVDKNGVSHTVAAKNAGKTCGGTKDTNEDCKHVVGGHATDADCNPPKDCKGVVNGTATTADCNPTKDCKGVVNGTATMADCNPPKSEVCSDGSAMPASGVCPTGTTVVTCPDAASMPTGPLPKGCERPSTGDTGGEENGGPNNTGEQPVVGNTNTVPTVINGRPASPATIDETALPFTGTDALLLAQLAGLLLLVGGGLVGMSRKKKAIAAL
ncbi:MAG: hypothetical protein ABR614_04770 [Mycobacteriales bacterium]